MSKQSTALDLADSLEAYEPVNGDAANELRQLHSENERLYEVNRELIKAVEQAVDGSWLDPQGLNHDDDSLLYIARYVSDKWGQPQLMAHIKRLSAALAKATGESK